MDQERQNIALIGSIDLLQEIGTKSTLTHLGDSLLEQRNGGEIFSLYETLVLTNPTSFYSPQRETMRRH